MVSLTLFTFGRQRKLDSACEQIKESMKREKEMRPIIVMKIKVKMRIMKQMKEMIIEVRTRLLIIAKEEDKIHGESSR